LGSSGLSLKSRYSLQDKKNISKDEENPLKNQMCPTFDQIILSAITDFGK
jgi:hypothetical protein